jgi:hypothetical protein
MRFSDAPGGRFPGFQSSTRELDSRASDLDDASGGAEAAPFADPPEPKPDRGARTMDKRIFAAILAAMALFMYISVFVKFGT